jgi:group I intron endonuclease
MKYTIYQITNKLNGKIYIGKHQTENINDGYFGSGVALKEAIKKYGKECFEKEILFVFDTEVEMNDKERELITEDFVKRKDTYNLGVGGEGGPHFKGKTHTDEIKEKIRDASVNQVWTEVRKNKIYENNLRTNKSRGEKTSKALTGRKLSEETKRKIANSASGKKLSEETKRKISESIQKRNANKKDLGQVS